MNIRLKKLPDNIQSSARYGLLAPEAVPSIVSIEQETGGLVYRDFWKCATSSMLHRRLKRNALLPAYSAFNYGLALAVDLDKTTRNRSYTDLLEAMERNGWYCYRVDKVADQPGAEQFTFLGADPGQYLEKAVHNPESWDRPGEARIYEKYGTEFSLSPPQVQSLLKKLGFFHGEVDGSTDLYSREAVMAFQRAWGLTTDGVQNMTLQRVLAFVAASVEILT